MSKGNFVYVLGGLYNGGQERQLMNLAQIFKSHEYNVKVVIWNKSNYSTIVLERFIEAGVECIFLEGSKWKRFQKLRKIVKQANIVHCFAYYMNFFVWLTTRFTKAIAIGGLRGDIAQYVGGMGEGKTALNAIFIKYLISNSEIQGKELKRKYSFLAPKIAVVRNGYQGEMNSLPPIFDGKMPLKVVSIGRLVDYKRYDLIFEVLANLSFDWKLNILGSGSELNNLQHLSKILGISDNVNFIGEVNNVDDYIKNAHVVLHLSDFEGTCNVIMESMALARPVVATDVGDNCFLVKNGLTGFLVPRSDGIEAGKRMEELYAHPELLTKMSENALLYAKENFSMELYKENALKAYKSFGFKTIRERL